MMRNFPKEVRSDCRSMRVSYFIPRERDWPSQSPDLNPIEHLWSELGRQIRKRPQAIKNITELETALQEEWGKISMNQIISLIESMPRRIEAVITSNGWPTKY